MRPYSVMRMFEFLVVAVIEEMVGDSFNPHFTESMTLRSFLISLRMYNLEVISLREFDLKVISLWEFDLKVISLWESDPKVISLWESDLKVISAWKFDLKVILQTRDVTDRPTDRPTDGPTYEASYRDARTHLKSQEWIKINFWSKIFSINKVFWSLNHEKLIENCLEAPRALLHVGIKLQR